MCYNHTRSVGGDDVEVESAVIHYYYESENTITMSDKVLNLAQMPEFEEALTKIFQSFLRYSQQKTFKLEDSGAFKDIEEEHFIKQSQRDAKNIFNLRKQDAKNRIIMCLACKVYHDEKVFYTFYEFHPKTAFVPNKDQIERELTLPDRFASSKLAVMFDMFDYEGAVKVNEKDYSWFADTYQVDVIPNAKETYQMIHRWTQEIAEKRGLDPIKQGLENKKVLSHLSDSFDVVSAEDFSEEVLGGIDEAEKALLQERFAIEKIEDELDLAALRKARVSQNIMIKTDKGIEVKIPLKDLILDDVLEIDDSLQEINIILKNVGDLHEQ